MLGTPELLFAGVVTVRSGDSFLFLEVLLCIRVLIVILNLEEHLLNFQTDFYWMFFSCCLVVYDLVHSWNISYGPHLLYLEDLK